MTAYETGESLPRLCHNAAHHHALTCCPCGYRRVDWTVVLRIAQTIPRHMVTSGCYRAQIVQLLLADPDMRAAITTKENPSKESP